MIAALGDCHMMNLKVIGPVVLNALFYLSHTCLAAELHNTYQTRFEIQTPGLGGAGNGDFAATMPGFPSLVTIGAEGYAYFTMEVEPTKVDGEWQNRFRILVSDSDPDSAKKLYKEVVFERFAPMFEPQYKPIKMQYQYQGKAYDISYTATRFY